MDFELLRHFLAVAEYKNITRAAESLYLTQPTLSKHISMFEEQMGAKLLVRNNRMVELTEAGKVLCEEGQKLLRYIDEIETRVLRTQSGSGGAVKVVSEPMDYLPMDQFFKQYQRTFPEVDLSIQHMAFNRIVAELDGQLADAGLVRSFEVENRQYLQRYDMYKVYSTKLLLAVSLDNPLSARHAVRLEELAGEKLICLRHLIDGNSRLWAELVQRSGCVIARTLPENMEDLVFYIRSGQGFSFVDWNSRKHYTAEAGCSLVEIEGEELPFDIIMLISKLNTNAALPTFRRALLQSFPGAVQLK